MMGAVEMAASRKGSSEIQIIDPLADSRWDGLVDSHPRASVFHRRGWLEALARTYGYKPLVLTSGCAGGALENGLVLCRVSSWITGTRLVSLPFADHCDPLLRNPNDVLLFDDWLRAECVHHRYKYVELRPLVEFRTASGASRPNCSYYFHKLDIRVSLEEIFASFHRDCVQRKIKRAEREHFSYEAGASERLMDEFYGLLLITRKRLLVLPQPRSWFSNLLECFADDIQIRVIRANGTPAAAILTLRHGTSVVYKYGCSDSAFHNRGVMQLLFWRLIEESKASGIERIDFGRSDLDSEGLVTFKDRLGAQKQLLTYYRYPGAEKRVGCPSWNVQALRQCFKGLPNIAFCAAGRILYRHMG